MASGVPRRSSSSSAGVCARALMFWHGRGYVRFREEDGASKLRRHPRSLIAMAAYALRAAKPPF
eukprot:388011-Lingulodinium_polyedra.AAC.1